MTAAIATGKVLKDRYRLERLLGRGGMAAVWRGHDEVLDRPVAIKVISDTLSSDSEFVARFRREAKVAAGLSHPNLVGVYDFAVTDERPYLVMEFIPGEDLATHISRNWPVDCWRLATELLDAVAHIHAAGILHRDIKPQNIVLTPEGTAKLIDFGIALPTDATSLTQTGLVLGSQRFVAPEVMQGAAATERSDLYSCGVVLRSCPGGGAPELVSLASWLASADPQSRPASARQARARLERRRIAGQPTQAFSPTFARPEAPPASRRGRWGAAIALVGVLAALAALVFVPGDDGGQKDRSSTVTAGDRTEPGAAAGRAAEAPRTADATGPGPSRAAQPPAPAGDDPERGSLLNQEGFEAIQAGRYEEAIPLLEEAVRAFPPGTESLDYAYALFNLGNALRLSGRAAEAVPVLERRLEIPNQTDVVRRELEAARSEAG